ncbi:MAG TPA: hypothetical protein PLO37_23230 [Candidatus Hydrogenedentes bacterium]|nr:hypothetical protein [Candidatus Hydrogenedentota bacterium]HPG69773.1 hypothetical protein [Candidatus Hydrogenedentota bacterium]
MMPQEEANFIAYDIQTWRRAKTAPGELVYRPSSSTLIYRLILTVLTAFIIYGLYRSGGVDAWRTISHGPPRPASPVAVTPPGSDSDGASTGLSTERLAQLQQERTERMERQRQSLEQIDYAIAWILCVAAILCALVGLLAPASTLWQSVRVRRDPRGDIEFRRRGFTGLVSSRSCPRDQLAFIGTSVHESFAGRRPRRPLGWRWRVTVYSRKDAPGLTPFAVDFLCLLERERPSQHGRLPAVVEQLVDGLEGVTGLTCDRTYGVAEARGPRLRRGVITTHAVATSEPHVTRTTRTFRSLDEIPEDLRERFGAQLEQMRVDVERTGQPQQREVSSRTITVRDSSGQTRTYHSIEEMPPELRARYEQFVRQRRQRPSRERDSNN